MNFFDDLPETEGPANAHSGADHFAAETPVQVWLVDDNDGLRDLIAQLLEQQGGIVCARQFNSPNGLLSALASQRGPDVILLDVQMGEFNGLDAIPGIKSLARETHVFMLTTFFDPEWHEQAMASGASGYHLKSDSMTQLADRISRSGGAEAPGARFPRRKYRRRTSPGSRHLEPRGQSGLDGKSDRPPTRLRNGLKSTSWLGWFKRFSSN